MYNKDKPYPSEREGVRAEATGRSPRLKYMYYVVDMTTFKVQLYQTLALLRKSFVRGLWGVKQDVYYVYLARDIKKYNSVIIANRYIVGRTNDIYMKCLKQDEKYLQDMSPDYLTQSIPPIIL